MMKVIVVINAINDWLKDYQKKNPSLWPSNIPDSVQAIIAYRDALEETLEHYRQGKVNPDQKDLDSIKETFQTKNASVKSWLNKIRSKLKLFSAITKHLSRILCYKYSIPTLEDTAGMLPVLLVNAQQEVPAVQLLIDKLIQIDETHLFRFAISQHNKIYQLRANGFHALAQYTESIALVLFTNTTISKRFFINLRGAEDKKIEEKFSFFERHFSIYSDTYLDAIKNGILTPEHIAVLERTIVFEAENYVYEHLGVTDDTNYALLGFQALLPLLGRCGFLSKEKLDALLLNNPPEKLLLIRKMVLLVVKTVGKITEENFDLLLNTPNLNQRMLDNLTKYGGLYDNNKTRLFTPQRNIALFNDLFKCCVLVLPEKEIIAKLDDTPLDFRTEELLISLVSNALAKMSTDKPEVLVEDRAPLLQEISDTKAEDEPSLNAVYTETQSLYPMTYLEGASLFYPYSSLNREISDTRGKKNIKKLEEIGGEQKSPTETTQPPLTPKLLGPEEINTTHEKLANLKDKAMFFEALIMPAGIAGCFIGSAVGFAVGGPIGAVIGGCVGGVLGVAPLLIGAFYYRYQLNSVTANETIDGSGSSRPIAENSNPPPFNPITPVRPSPITQPIQLRRIIAEDPEDLLTSGKYHQVTISSNA